MNFRRPSSWTSGTATSSRGRSRSCSPSTSPARPTSAPRPPCRGRCTTRPRAGCDRLGQADRRVVRRRGRHRDGADGPEGGRHHAGRQASRSRPRRPGQLPRPDRRVLRPRQGRGSPRRTAAVPSSSATTATSGSTADGAGDPAHDDRTVPARTRPVADGTSADATPARRRWREKHPDAARTAARVATGLAAVLVLFALLMPNQLTLLTPGRFVHIPVEGILVAALLLALPPKARRVVGGASSGWSSGC